MNGQAMTLLRQPQLQLGGSEEGMAAKPVLAAHLL